MKNFSRWQLELGMSMVNGQMVCLVAFRTKGDLSIGSLMAHHLAKQMHRQPRPHPLNSCSTNVLLHVSIYIYIHIHVYIHICVCIYYIHKFVQIFFRLFVCPLARAVCNCKWTCNFSQSLWGVRPDFVGQVEWWPVPVIFATKQRILQASQPILTSKFLFLTSLYGTPSWSFCGKVVG